MSESVYVLVQGRRPLGLEDENDSEYSATIRIAYDFLIKQNISKDNILLFTTSRERDQAYYVDLASRGNLFLSDPASFVQNTKNFINSKNAKQIFIHFVSHGGTDKIGEVWDTVEKNKRGINYCLQERKEDSDRWWLLFPHKSPVIPRCSLEFDRKVTQMVYEDWDNPSIHDITNSCLHWQDLMPHLLEIALQTPDRKVVIIGGACYSGGLFDQWLTPENLDVEEKVIGLEQEKKLAKEKILEILGNKYTFEQIRNAPIYVQTSADSEYMAGTWFWYEWWRTVDQLLSNNEGKTLRGLYSVLHAKDPTKEFDTTHEARGEKMDALMVSQFYGDKELKEISLSQVFSKI